MYLVFDIGGTNMRVAVSSDGKTLAATKTVPTPKDFEQGILILKQTADKFSDGQKIEAAAGAVRYLDKTKTKIPKHPNIGLWSNQPLKQRLETTLGVTVFLENDATLSGLGEAVNGAGIGKRIVAYITVGTGVGGVRIADGRIDKNALGFEPGFQLINNEYLESLISGYGLKKRYGKEAIDITDPKIWGEVAKYLAIGLNNTIVHWSPDIVILGGAVMKSISLDKVRAHLQDVLTIFPQIPEIVPTKLGDSAGLYGALALLGD